MNLFKNGNFTLHSGAQSNYKIDCDALTDKDLETLALIAQDYVPKYGAVGCCNFFSHDEATRLGYCYFR